MCRHILNAQISVRAPCCKKWFDCPECHEEATKGEHELAKTTEMVLACKKCKKVFRKDLGEVEEADEYCPRCDNHYVIPAKTPQMGIGLQGDEDMIKDDRDRATARRMKKVQQEMGDMGGMGMGGGMGM